MPSPAISVREREKKGREGGEEANDKEHATGDLQEGKEIGNKVWLLKAEVVHHLQDLLMALCLPYPHESIDEEIEAEKDTRHEYGQPSEISLMVPDFPEDVLGHLQSSTRITCLGVPSIL